MPYHQEINRWREHPAIRLISSYPMLFGVFISFLIFVVIVVIQAWFPCIDKALGRREGLVRAIYFTAMYFAIYISRL